MSNIVIIGGGPSGFACAIRAAKNKNNKITILERNSSPMKKLLITGNGRCNYYNDDQNINHYHSKDNKLIKEIINEENLIKLTNFFDDIGLVPKIKNGYYYPYSNQAISVKENIINYANVLGINIINNYYVTDIKKIDNKFIINNDIECDKLVISTGSKAYPNTGSDGNGYVLAKKFNHNIITVLPSLVQIRLDNNFLKKWDGVRCEVNLSLYENEKLIKEESGELQLTNYGLSGICVFNLSGYIAKGLDKGLNEKIKINFIPFISSKEELIKYLEERSKKLYGRNIVNVLEGILNYKLINTILDIIKIDKESYFNDLTKEEKNKLAENLISFCVTVKETNKFDKSQVCSGGIPLSEINIKSMESLKINNLYFTGEIIDLDGDCGGYNLTIAWLTGILAGDNL